MASDGASGEVRYGVARVEDDATARPSATAATAFAPPRGARVFPIPHHHHASSSRRQGEEPRTRSLARTRPAKARACKPQRLELASARRGLAEAKTKRGPATPTAAATCWAHRPQRSPPPALTRRLAVEESTTTAAMCGQHRRWPTAELGRQRSLGCRQGA
uniref:Uncharacterized protein n=1 Tax=Oryza barthii TaxID=65489 RepID=A0A0D3ER14_9ORYZ